MNEAGAAAAWEQLASASSMTDVIAAQENIDGEPVISDLTPLIGQATPEWVQQLGVPAGWQLIDLPVEQRGAVTRLAAAGSRPDGGWEAVETLSVFSYTGYASFHEIADNAACTLRDLGALAITRRLLRVPPLRWAVAVRAEGVVNFAERQVFTRQSNYLVGSEEPHAGRLTIHNVMVDVAELPRWAADVDELSAAVHAGFVNTLEAVT